MTAIFAAGGTGGHIFPAIAVAQALKREEPAVRILFVGVGSEIEKRLLAAAGFELAVIPFVAVTGGGIVGLIRSLLVLPGALWAAYRLYRQERPEVVIGFGGFPSFVPMLCAWVMRIPRVLHEQNVKVGLANKALSLLVNRIYAAHGASGFWSKKPVVFSGNPVRQAFEQVSDWQEPKSDTPFTLLIVGGSQGAVSLNEAVLEMVGTLGKAGIRIIHQSGAVDLERVKSSYEEISFPEAKVQAFIEDISQAYQQANLVICRAGAMTVAEVSAAGRPAIFVPLPIAAGHQAQNAQSLVRAGAAVVLTHGPDLGVRLRKVVEDFIANPQQLATMATRSRESSRQGGLSAAAQIAQAVRDCACEVTS